MKKACKMKQQQDREQKSRIMEKEDTDKENMPHNKGNNANGSNLTKDELASAKPWKWTTIYMKT